jgi:hypothetical protein
MTSRLIAAGAVALACSVVTMAQGGRPRVRPALPRPKCSEVRRRAAAKRSTRAGNGSRYHGRPIRRGRDVLGGSGASYGKVANPMHRCGAPARTTRRS